MANGHCKAELPKDPLAHHANGKESFVLFYFNYLFENHDMDWKVFDRHPCHVQQERISVHK